MQLLVFLLACYGVTNIITISRLSGVSASRVAFLFHAERRDPLPQARNLPQGVDVV